MKFNISRLQQFQTCEQKYKWKYVDDLEPKWDGVPKPLGTAFHAGVAALYRGEGRSAALEVGLGEYYKDPAMQAARDGFDDNAKQSQDVRKGEIQLRAMLDQYPWGQEGLEDVVAIEKDMEWKVTGQHTLVFRADRLIRVNGKLWLHDTKTTGQEVGLMVKVQRLRTQYVGYAAGVEALLGEELAGVMLDVVHKPEVYFKKTGEFSSMKEPGFLREPIHKTREQLGEFKEWFDTLTRRIMTLEHNGARQYLKNTDSCLAYNSMCPYLNLCLRPDWVEGLKGTFGRRERDYGDE